MNVSYQWLKAFVPFDETPVQLRELLTAHVATVDELVALRQDLAPIVIARVIEEAPHPDSDHLHVTKVDAGTGTLLDVVCGAPNVTAGKVYPFAPTGTVMPNGLKIQKRKIRGAISDGMLCSARELGVGDEQDGILELNIDVPPGTPFLKALPVGDTQIVLDVGANRPDLLSHLGVAREVSAITRKALRLPELPGVAPLSVAGATRAPRNARASAVEVSIADEGLVRRFMGLVIRGVRVGPSPDWLVKRLEAVGSRSINNVVDASNYVLHELGQPTHAFDLGKLAGPSIIVRRAKGGEKLTTLDGSDRALTDEMIVIADANKAQAVAGVMGGRDSEVTEGTTDLFLEVANFDPRRIRNARRALGMSTDASYRFERGVDIEIAPQALERVARLIVGLAGGRLDGAPVDLVYEAASPRRIQLRESRVAMLLGEQVPAKDIAALLESVGFKVTSDLSVEIPSWRSDVAAEVDLIEEVARLRGYDSFPLELRPFRPTAVGDDPQWLTSRRVRDLLVGQGMIELRPMPFVAGGPDYVRVLNPLAENEAHLRRSVLETLARRAEHNLSRMEGNLRLFEIGSAFEPSEGELPTEELRVAALVMGRRNPAHFSDPKTPEFADWINYGEWDAKSLGRLTAATAYPGALIELAVSDNPELLWDIRVDGTPTGTVRRLTLDAPVWAAPAFGIELSLGVLASAAVAPQGESAHRKFESARPVVTRYRELPTTPASEFDLALLVPEAVRAEAVEEVMRRVSGRLLERVELFDRYVGSGVEAGHRSLAWRLTFRHAERTLRDREIETRRTDILRALADELNVRQRTG